MKCKAKFGIIVVSDRVYEGKAEDYSGNILARNIVEKEDHKVIYYNVVPNRRFKIEKSVEEALKKNVEAVLLIGGTGLGPRDITVDVIENLADREIPGFGEVFRYLTFTKEGTKTWLTRATACVYKGTLLFAIPGSPSAVELALKEIILPEICHAINVVKGVSHWDEKHKSNSSSSNLRSTICNNNHS